MTYSYNQFYPNMVHPSYFANALSQNYNLPQQNTITTQPPIMQPQLAVTKIIPVSTKEEASVSPVDLVNGTPSFFYNKSNGEIYFKRFDVPTGTAIFKIYAELQPVESPTSDVSVSGNVNIYEKEFKHINEGIDSLHRLIQDLKEVNNDESVKYVKYASKGTESESDTKPIKRK